MMEYMFFKEFMHIYFWVYLITFILEILFQFTDEYRENKYNAIKRGIFTPKINFISVFAFVLWIMSFQY